MKKWLLSQLRFPDRPLQTWGINLGPGGAGAVRAGGLHVHLSAHVPDLRPARRCARARPRLQGAGGPAQPSLHPLRRGCGSIAFDPQGRRYTIDPDGPGPAAAFTVPDPDFDFESLRANAVVRWEFVRGSALYAVWNGSRKETRDVPGSSARDAFLIKASYWFGR